MKLFKKNKDIEMSFVDWVFRQNYDWKAKIFQISYNPILMMFINLCLYFDWFNNEDKFKPGDKVKYNFFTHIAIPGIEQLIGNKKNSVYTVIYDPIWGTKYKSCVCYKDEAGNEGSCAVFWLKKVS